MLATAQAATLVSSNSVWRYKKGTAEASSPDTTAWRQLSFDDSTWLTGPTTLYYGETITGGTLFSDMQNNYSTIFLRQKFVVTNLAELSSLSLNAVCDDGFIAWVNGVQVLNYNAPGGAIAFNSLAAANVAEPVQFANYPLGSPAGYLTSGINVLAVQVFNVNLTSSDIVFNTELTATLKETMPPTILSFTPDPGNVLGLTQIAVTFSEPVAGVDASDLMINGQPAASVSGSGAVYTFNLPPLGYGTALVTWNLMSGITDLAAPPNGFNASGPGTSWSYNLVDPESPTVVLLNPPAGSTVKNFSQVEVQFSELVDGVDAADLLLNGAAATNVVGLGAGPYVFQFPALTSGVAQLAWAADHGITDLSVTSNRFAGGSWQYAVNSQAAVGDLVINEFVAENISGLKDEDGEEQDWIEIYNRGTNTVNLLGWSLTDDPNDPGQWVFPSITLTGRTYLVVFASGKDRKPTTAVGKLHTNFKLNSAGEYLGLFNAESPRQSVSELSPEFPDQRNDYSYGRDNAGNWRYYKAPTPGTGNGNSSIIGAVEAVHFSVERGFFKSPFNLSLATPTPGATIRVTFDGSVPTATNGLDYTNAILINATRIIRAAAFRNDYLPSKTITHTYLYNLSAAQRSLPVVSLVTAPNNLTSRTGIIGISGGTYTDGTWRAVTTNDYYNPIKKGIAWERPMSVEFIQPADNRGFWTECGIRVHASDYFRPRMHIGDKFSFTLYFRGDYGTSALHYPWFTNSVVEDFDEIVLRAGSNDPTNPFLRDQFVRRLAAETGQIASHGNFVTMFINGKISHTPNFYYNPCERIEKRFCEKWHGGTENWDVREQFGQMVDGTSTAFSSMMNYVNGHTFAASNTYQEISRQLDVTNFVDYLLPLIYGDTGDWPGNNWRAARERVTGAKFRFYVWDAEWSCGFNNPVTHNTLTDQLGVGNGAEIAVIYQKLKASPEFRLLFADRVHKHLFNNGALTDARIKAAYDELKATLSPAISSFDNSIGTTWIPQRRRSVTNHLALAGLMLSSNAPMFSQFGGRVAGGFNLTMTNAATNGIIYYTTNGADPRVAFTGAVSTNALGSTNGALVVLDQTVLVRARTLLGTNWSAMTEATFQVAELGLPLRITEIMYNPPGGDAYEYLELQNISTAPVDLSGITVEGVGFRFPEGKTLAAGARWVLISDENPAAFAQRYPGVVVGGIYTGRLSNSGERLALVDRNGRTITAVTFDHTRGWPSLAFDQGRSLEIFDVNGDPDDPANWRASLQPAGSPGAVNPVTPPPNVRFNEVLAENLGVVANGGTYPDFVELYNADATSVNLSGWSFTDDGNARKFVFPANVSIAAGGYLVVWCDSQTSAPGLHAGFALGRNGESLFLYDWQTNRVDAMSYGLQLANSSVGRAGEGSEAWQLTEPSPGGLNEVANVGQASELVINEFMANPSPGSDDWLELFNQNRTLPVALRGLYVGTSDALFQIKSLSFVAPGGFVQLIADEKPGADHVDFKLPAAGGSLVIFDQNGLELNRINYSAQSEGVSFGRLPDGAGLLSSFATTASPGASNYVSIYSGPMLNEIMARNERAVTNSEGRVADWVEVYNPNATTFDLSSMSLSVDKNDPGQWTFPPGTTIGPNAYRVLWCDGSRAASTNLEAELYVGHALDGSSGGAYLFNASGQLVDLVEYGFQLPDLSIGKSGGVWNLLTAPTPGATNAPAASIGSQFNLRLNEWRAGSAEGEDWFEIYNLDPLPVNLAGIYLTDDPSLAGQTNFLVGPLSFIAGKDWAKWKADGQLDKGRDHVGFSLDGLGETLRVYNSSLGIIDSVDFGVQPRIGTQGRFPDGANFIADFPTTASPEESNYLPLPNVVINEVLTHSDPPLEDAIELFNPSAQPVDIGGWFLSNSQIDFKKYRVLDGTMIAGGGYKVFYEYQFNSTPSATTPFTLNSAHGDEVHLSAADTNGVLTGYRASIKFGAAENSVSFGRYVTSVGEELVAMSARTFGVDELPFSLAQFRAGLGLPNSEPKVGPVVINEIMYHPVSLVGTNWVENEEEEFVELFNLSADDVKLFDPGAVTNTWRLRGGIDFVFPQDVTLAAQSYLLVVNFDPATNATARAAFQNKYQVPADIRLFGPYQGKLSNAGETIELVKPDPPQQPPHPDAGFVPYVLVDRVVYSDRYPWPNLADGTGFSLQRRMPALYGNDPVSWKAAAPTALLSNVTPDEVDSDGDGMPDSWEIANGLDRFDASDADNDPDHDGFSNLQEFRSGTDPNLAQSVLKLDSLSLAIDGVLTLRFVAVAGKSYSVQYRDDMTPGPWSVLKDIEAQPNSRLVEVQEVAPSDVKQRFYRIVTPQQPGP